MLDFSKLTFRDFEDIPGTDVFGRTRAFGRLTRYMAESGHMNYRLETLSGCGPEMTIRTPFDVAPRRCVSFVSNDYLNFSQHHAVKRAVLAAVEHFGTGSGASPLIGGYYSYHRMLEERIAAFFGRTAEEAATFTTGYTANSATLLALLRSQDIALVDASAHTSVFEGLLHTTRKTFRHNDLESLERLLRIVRDGYQTKLVIVDGVYSQDGDLAPLDKMVALCRQYGAHLMVDDAHGVGVLGGTGRGALERFGVLGQVDILTGTFSKAFGGIGGFVIASPELVNYIRFQSRQQIFSVTATPAVMGIVKAIDLIDEEPHWRTRLWENAAYLRGGLLGLGFDVGQTVSPIIPVKIGDPHRTGDMGRMLLERDVFTNPILYPAVARKDARIRMGVMATHTREHLDKALEAFGEVGKKVGVI